MSITSLSTPADMISVLKDYGFEYLSDNQFLSIINEVQNDVCALEAWPFLEVVLTFSTSANTNNNFMPANAAQILFLVNTTTGTTLIPSRWDEIQKNWANLLTQQAEPQWYYFQGDQAFLYPIPDTSYTLLGAVQAMPTVLTTTSDAFTWPTRHLYVILYGVLVKLYGQEDDENASQYYQTMMNTRMDRARQDIWTRQFDRFDTIKDIMSDDWYGY